MKSLPKKPLTNIDLLTYVKLLKILNFRGVFMRNKLPSTINKNECGIINLDNWDGPGTHWTAYKKTEKCVIYFDSFGNLRPPLEVLKYFNSNGVSNIKYNYNSYQSYNNFNCGHLCLEFLCNNVIRNK